MNTGSALATFEGWFFTGLALLAGVFGLIESTLRQMLNQLGVGRDIQSVVILALAVIFIVAVLRLFAGVFRLLLLLFLVLLVLHVLLPGNGF